MSNSTPSFSIGSPKSPIGASLYSTSSSVPPLRAPISTVIPPLLLGTATFNSQYNPDPYQLPTTKIVHRALELGIRAFDSSPYYGPAEILLGAALNSDYVKWKYPRSEYFLSTKVGRIASDKFDYSPQWVRKSISRSLERLGTEWLDLVFCHDVEFVYPFEVLMAVRALRELRDEGKIRYVGISGYPTDVLCELADMVLKETGEPLDAVMSYANYTLQNTKLWTEAVPRLKHNAGVEVVLNASPLGMGLLRSQGVPMGSMGDFHPSAQGLRKACHEAAEYCQREGKRLETVAVRFALENWTRLAGPLVGTKVGATRDAEGGSLLGEHNLGVSVCGVSYVEELEETVQVWNSILAAQLGNEEHLQRRRAVEDLARGVKEAIGDWVDNTWASPPDGYSRLIPQIEGLTPKER